MTIAAAAASNTTLLPIFASFNSKTLKSISPKSKTLKSISPKSKTLNSKTLNRRSPPVSISTDPSHLDPLLLQHLLSSAAHCPHRFPLLSGDGRPEPADVRKLATAVAHSAVVVSVFCRQRFLEPDGRDADPRFGFEDLFERAIRVPGLDHRLVGFGRAVSDGGLTASIHDVVVMPSLQRLGIGRKIVQRIVRVFTGKGIYDISALCSQKERIHPGIVADLHTNRSAGHPWPFLPATNNELLFFQSCGFGEDSLGSTTMMYTRTARFSQDMVRPAGRLLLLVPSTREPYLFKKIAARTEDTE